jgi:hypothetical protein
MDSFAICSGGQLMSEGLHKVVLYFNERSKQFTITARMDRARLPGVDKQMSQRKFTRKLIAEGLDKETAEENKKRERAKWKAKGYTYQTRLKLS